MNQHMVIIACVQTPPYPQETSIFPEGRAGGSVHRLGHKKENTVTYFRAAFLAQHQPPYYGLLTQTHFQIAEVYWWRFFFCGLPHLLIFQPPPPSSSVVSDVPSAVKLVGRIRLPTSSAHPSTYWLVDEAAYPCAVL